MRVSAKAYCNLLDHVWISLGDLFFYFFFKGNRVEMDTWERRSRGKTGWSKGKGNFNQDIMYEKRIKEKNDILNFLYGYKHLRQTQKCQFYSG